MNTSSCIFCKGSPVTKEDMVSLWILKLFERELVSKETKVAVKGRKGVTYWESGQPNRHTVKCVCAECNNGWMSDIEQRARPTLVNMIRGLSMTLNTAQQEAVASWACLKTMIGAYAWGVNPIPEDWLEYFYREHLPPDGWAVLTARYVGSMLQMFDSYRFGREPVATSDARSTNARHKNILASLVVGNVAISIRALRDEIDLKEPPNLLSLWPSSTRDLLWPPGIITDATLPDFRQMGVGRGPHLADPDLA